MVTGPRGLGTPAHRPSADENQARSRLYDAAEWPRARLERRLRGAKLCESHLVPTERGRALLLSAVLCPRGIHSSAAVLQLHCGPRRPVKRGQVISSSVQKLASQHIRRPCASLCCVEPRLHVRRTSARSIRLETACTALVCSKQETSRRHLCKLKRTGLVTRSASRQPSASRDLDSEDNRPDAKEQREHCRQGR
jgi:hypothetical protein